MGRFAGRTEKRCYVCGITKPVADFNRRKDRGDGIDDLCRACKKELRTPHTIEQVEAQRRIAAEHRRRPHIRERAVAYMREYQRRPEVKARHSARNAVKDALRSGRLVRPPTCEACEQPAHTDAHHRDYARPLDVHWVCRPCHALLHRENPFDRPNSPRTPLFVMLAEDAMRPRDVTSRRVHDEGYREVST